MQTGKLRHRIVIESFTAARDDHGGVTTATRTYSTLATVWGRVEPMKGRELLDGMQMEAQATHKVTVRQRSDITAHMQLKHTRNAVTRTFDILSVLDDDERGKTTTMICTEVVPSLPLL